MSEWQWIGVEVAHAINDEQLREHGGASGLRSAGLLASALANPKQAHVYTNPDAFDLAASCAFILVRDHPFIDGNKRTAWVLARLFLAMHDKTIRYTDADATIMMLKLAAGETTALEFAAWLRSCHS